MKEQLIQDYYCESGVNGTPSHGQIYTTCGMEVIVFQMKLLVVQVLVFRGSSEIMVMLPLLITLN